MELLLLPLRLFAANGVSVECLGDAQCDTGLPQVNANDSNLQTALQITFAIIGAVAVIIVIVAALRFVTARGNPQDAAGARQAIIYALIGLVIAISAEALVTFVLTGL